MLSSASRGKRTAEGPELALGDPFVALPPVIAGEVHMIPTQRGDIRESGIVDLTVPAQSGDRAFEIDGVPEHDGACVWTCLEQRRQR